MQTNQKLIEVLNNLIQINVDRVAGYEKAAAETRDLDVDLHSIFNNMAKDSRDYVTQLMEEVNQLAGWGEANPAHPVENVGAGKEWRAGFPGFDRQSILESCEMAEESVQRQYNKAFASNDEIDGRIMTMISSQKAQLKTAHKVVKNYRDEHFKLTA